MTTVTTIAELQSALAGPRSRGQVVGFVPTMGALHAGHASLVSRCAGECHVTVVSVFLNPTQFNDPRDLQRYPRTLDADLALCHSHGADVVFCPSVQEMYPQPDTRVFSYPPTDSVMEGAHRPGHFNGVCQIVSKLFDAVQPQRAYFGEKDFQQIAVIRRMVQHMGYGVQVVPCPVVREPSGLAMSSRNTLLLPHEREAAAAIYQRLTESVALMRGGMDVEQTHKYVCDALNSTPELSVEYYSIVDGSTLAPVAQWADSQDVVGCITVYCGSKPVRLIDHIRYK